MKKRIYRSTHVKDLNAESLIERVEGHSVVIGIDVAKSVQFAAVMLESREGQCIFRWNQLNAEENRLAFEILDRLRVAVDRVDLVLEPSGTYGDPLAYRADSMGIEGLSSESEEDL